MRGIPTGKYRTKPLEIACFFCGKIFNVKLIGTLPKYCSDKCARDALYERDREKIIKINAAYRRKKLHTDENYRLKNIQDGKINAKKREMKAKQTLLNFLGNKCDVCGIDIVDVLVVHHTNGEGHINQYRKNVGTKQKIKTTNKNRYQKYLAQYLSGEPMRLLCQNHHVLLHRQAERKRGIENER